MTRNAQSGHSRRSVLQGLAGSFLLKFDLGCDADADGFEFSVPPARAITRGPSYHWFGYYDKLAFDPTNRYVLGMEVDFENRSPTASDVLRVGMVDLHEEDRWIDLGTSYAWNWQQGCMLQWIPADSNQVVWNDRDGSGNYVARILDLGERRGVVKTLPLPIFCLSPDGATAFCIDYARIQTVRKGYGYPGLPDPFGDILAPEASGIWRMNMQTGENELIFSIADAAAIPPLEGEWSADARHWVYHLLSSPDGSRLAFLHCNHSETGMFCRLLTIDPDGRNPRVLDPYGSTSHFCWRDSGHILAWARQAEGFGFFLFDDKTLEVDEVGAGVMRENGHCTYLPDTRWILNDIYPDADRVQGPYLFDTDTEDKYSLGSFYSSDEYTFEFRCDNHPRASRDGRAVVIDSPHVRGRQMYIIDISSILDSV